MSWLTSLSLLLIGLIALLLTSLPVAFCFLLINMVFVIFLFGGFDPLFSLVLSQYDSVSSFVLAPVPLFVLMGEFLFHSNMATRALDVFDRMMGRIPGRLFILAILGGTVFSALTGSAMANAAMLGSTLIPEMVRRGYNRNMSLGTIIGAGGIAILIPPSSLAVILGSLAYLSISKILIGGIIPGLLMAIFFLLYITGWCTFRPTLAPVYDFPEQPLRATLLDFARYVMPLSILIFLVIGLIILGVATPTESAAMGAVGAAILGRINGDLGWRALKRALLSTFRISVMVMIIIAMASGYSQLMGFTGSARGLIKWVTELQMAPILVIITMNFILLILGCFIEQVCIMILTIPLFFPIVKALGYDPLWFGILMLINMEVAVNSPPFGLLLFVIKGIAPEGTSMTDVYKAAIPFVVLEIIVLALMLVFPNISLWLPRLVE